MQHTRAAYNETDSWPTGEVTVGGRGVGGRLFVAEGDEADTELQTFFGDLDDGDADETEDYSDAQMMEGEGDLLRSR